jgi:catechol 2,3-dioxygenase-like lactoylglutathione lyase family enzyme
VKLQHVSIPVSAGGEEEARAFYGGMLGLRERSVGRGLDPAKFIWFETGPGLELHLILGDEHADPEERRHFCLEVDDLEAMRARIEDAGAPVLEATPIAGRPRFFLRDPFDNLVELTHIEG